MNTGFNKEIFKFVSWLPVSRETTAEFMNLLREKAGVETGRDNLRRDGMLSPVMVEFQDLIDNDSIIRMNFMKMIDQVPSYYKETGPDGKYLHGYYLQSIEEMIILINHILTTAPEYNDTELVGFPINTILNWTMGVPAGGAAFRNEKVNAMFKKVLAVWTEFLETEKSLYVFNKSENGWCCSEALEKLNMHQYLNDEDYEIFRSGWKAGEYFPYKSWNDFFIRVFKDDKQRPIDHDQNVVVSACDSTVYNIQHNARLQDWFWLKSQPYSLRDMLANQSGDLEGMDKVESDEKHFEKFVKPFDGGTVYQAFLSAFKYHRWNSPVDGVIKKAYVKEGTYYSATQSEGMDQGSPDLSQGYIAHTAARAMIYIEATDPAIGLMCVMPIGMAEVSSCILNEKIKPGYKISKGDELGYFQFGGSTYCMVFQKGVIDKFEVKKEDDIHMGCAVAITKQK